MSNSEADIRAFIARWQASGAAERANFAKFIIELCDILGVDAPEATMADDERNAYVFEKAVPLPHGTMGRIDLYKRDCFVLEAKQASRKAEAKLRRGTAVRGTVAWDTAMQKAKQFGKRSKKRVAQIGEWLNTLALLGQARQLEDGRFVAV